MRANVGNLDAVIRGCLAAGFLALSVVWSPTPLASLSAAVVALAIAATAATHCCPLYTALGIDTHRHPS